jgi:hypothetical protein
VPLTTIEIEQTAHDNWHAEVVVGGTMARREVINSPSFDEVMIRVEDAYRRFVPSAPPQRHDSVPNFTVTDSRPPQPTQAPIARRMPPR